MYCPFIPASSSETPKFEIEMEGDSKAKTGDSVKLTCKPKGDIKSVEWKKDGQKVSTIFYDSLFKHYLISII